MYNNHTMANLLSINQPKPKSDYLSNAKVLVDTLVKLGVDSVFGYPGASVLSIYNELAKQNTIKHYLVRHEQAAVHAAEGYAAINGAPGVVLVTSGPGFTNTITGIANAYSDSTPLVILAGDVAGSSKHSKIFQKVDIISMTKTCCKKNYLLKPQDNIADIITEAFREANSGNKGPVVVALPRNFLESEYTVPPKTIQHLHEAEKDFSNDIKRLTQLIRNASKPLVLLGGGSIDAYYEIEKFISKVQIPVVSTLKGIGAYPSENNLYLGMIGLNGTYTANDALKQCDLLISIGASFSDRTTCKNNEFAENIKIVNINIKHISEDFELEIIGDAKDFLTQFLKSSDSFTPDWKWLIETDALKEDALPDVCSPNGLHSSFVLKTLSDFTKYYEPVVVTDVGQHQMLTAQFFNFNKPRKFITSGGLGTMGFGLPAAIGAYIANPQSLVLNITGDGSFQMNLQELATCREHNIPIKIIIMNNSYLGMVRELQEKIYNQRYQVEMINPDFTKIAEAYDLFAISVKTKEELIPALEKAINHNGTAIVDIVIDSFENI